MGRLSASTLVLAIGALAALGLSACGGSGGADLLPGATASQITANLDQVQQLVAEGECIGAANSAAEVSAQVDALGGVDKKLKQALREGADRLSEVVATCEEKEEEPTEAIETAETPEPEEKNKKPAKNKPEKETKEPPEEEAPTQNNGEGKGAEGGNGQEPPVETGPPSGGVGPGSPAGEE
jgi:hypothetical protein